MESVALLPVISGVRPGCDSVGVASWKYCKTSGFYTSVIRPGMTKRIGAQFKLAVCEFSVRIGRNKYSHLGCGQVVCTWSGDQLVVSKAEICACRALRN